MNTEQTAQQLELAAQILRTGHPWELKGVEEWHPATKYPQASPLASIFHGQEIRLALATPPDGRSLHNPDDLTAEQVGIGYRLLTKDEFQRDLNTHHYEWWSIENNRGWVLETGTRTTRSPLHNYGTTFRVPLSIPWPESPMPEPAFQLPPPPPGMIWLREDGWQEGDLPQGWRPLVLGEEEHSADEYFWPTDESWSSSSPLPLSKSVGTFFDKRRTRRPLAFEHAGKTWTWHRPGDPMPCDGDELIEIVCSAGRTEQRDGIKYLPRRAQHNIWEKTLGWRYADEKKTVPPTVEEKLTAIATECITWLSRGAEAGRCAGAVMRIINPPK